MNDSDRKLVDEYWMSRALDLAQQGLGRASPNPTVGCVIVKNDQLAGKGFHEYDRRDHAEIVALHEAGKSARGATAYVTLEPCSHHGRTGPCADALIAAEVGRVIVATEDANPAVHGRGIEKLRSSGIEVVVGVLQEPARRINDAFAKYIRTGLPYLTLKAAMTLDGRIAPPLSATTPGEITWITGPESREHVQALRHEADAVLTGIGTVLADDPQLTDRSGLPRRRPLLRVILDSDLRLPLKSKLVQSSNFDVLVFCSNPKPECVREHSAAGVSVKRLSPVHGHTQLPLPEVLKELGQMQITSVMIEAGSEVNASFISEGLVDRLFLFYAPRFLGHDARPLLYAAPSSPPEVRNFALHRFGPDFAVEGWLVDPWIV
jgi:diaminohydroxyphosphoribosylaminopyrimidine deaminase/5-amino-6-(5-phosphoribosylamino)uracil reductase